MTHWYVLHFIAKMVQILTLFIFSGKPCTWGNLNVILSPPLQFERRAYMHHFLSVCLGL